MHAVEHLATMATKMNPLQEAFSQFLTTLPAAQLQELLLYIRDPNAKDKHTPLLVETPTTPINDVTPEHGYLPTPNSRSPSLRGKRLREGKLRPLNSFIAFRSFYSTIFPELTQKAKSGILRFLWQNDPFKAKWALLAKAYSIVRDDHVREVSLDSFLNLNTAFIGIIEPARYLNVMGWELTVDGDGQYTMARVKTPTITETEVSTNYSVNDIVKRCYETGYVSETSRIRRNKKSHNDNGPLLAFAAQPSLLVNQNDGIYITGDSSSIDDVSDAKSSATSVTELSQRTPPSTSLDVDTFIKKVSAEFPEMLSLRNRLLDPVSDFDMTFDSLYGFGERFDPIVQLPHGIPFNYNVETPVPDYDPVAPLSFEPFDIDQFLNNF